MPTVRNQQEEEGGGLEIQNGGKGGGVISSVRFPLAVRKKKGGGGVRTSSHAHCKKASGGGGGLPKPEAHITRMKTMGIGGRRVSHELQCAPTACGHQEEGEGGIETNITEAK